MSDPKKTDHLKYGEGQREQYGEGTGYRPEEKTEAADKMDKAGFAGGKRKTERAPSGNKPDKAR